MDGKKFEDYFTMIFDQIDGIKPNEKFDKYELINIVSNIYNKMRYLKRESD